jgi:hypothetical protein
MQQIRIVDEPTRIPNTENMRLMLSDQPDQTWIARLRQLLAATAGGPALMLHVEGPRSYSSARIVRISWSAGGSSGNWSTRLTLPGAPHDRRHRRPHGGPKRGGSVMGAILRPQYAPPGQTYAEARQAGTLRESAVWWVRFRQHGKTVRQSTETTSEPKARAFLREREGWVALNIPVNVQADRLTLDEAADLIRQDNRRTGTSPPTRSSSGSRISWRISARRRG